MRTLLSRGLILLYSFAAARSREGERRLHQNDLSVSNSDLSSCYLLHQRLLLEEKLSAKLTDEVLPQYDFAESFLENTLPAAHLIRPCGAPSPPGEGFSGCVAKFETAR